MENQTLPLILCCTTCGFDKSFSNAWAMDLTTNKRRFSVGLRSRSIAGHVIGVRRLSWRKVFTPFVLWKDALPSWKMISSSPNILLIDGISVQNWVNVNSNIYLLKIWWLPSPTIVEMCMFPWRHLHTLWRKSTKLQHYHLTQIKLVIHHWLPLSSCQPLSMIGFLYSTVFVFQIYYVSFLSWNVHVFLGQPVSFSFTTFPFCSYFRFQSDFRQIWLVIPTYFATFCDDLISWKSFCFFD